MIKTGILYQFWEIFPEKADSLQHKTERDLF